MQYGQPQPQSPEGHRIVRYHRVFALLRLLWVPVLIVMIFESGDNTITKKSYRLKFAKDEKDNAGNVTTSHKHDLTGGGYAKRNWILVANAADESMVRNALADELGKAMGFEFTPNYQFVDLYINNEYKGTYMATDHVEADKEGDVTRRVPVDEKQGWLLDMVTADGIATGDIYVAGSDNYPYINIKNPEPGKRKTS